MLSSSGENVTLKTNTGRVTVASLIEAEQVLIAASSVHCKRAMAGAVEAKLSKSSDSSEFGAIYASTCNINSQSTGTIEIGSVHGYLRIAGESLQRVQVHSVNGSLDLEDSGIACQATVHFDSWGEGATSSIQVGGDVAISLEPTAPLAVELHGSKVHTETLTVKDAELDQLDEDYTVFTGVVEATSTQTTSSASSGKINVGSAKNAALRTSFFMQDSQQPESEEKSKGPSLFVHAFNGQVRLEQLDWMTKLKRKHLKQ